MSDYTIQLEETFLDYPDPEGNAIIVYFTGCSHHCPGCHSPLLQVVKKYAETKEEMVSRIRDFTRRAATNNLVFLGGDPLHTSNATLTDYFCKELGNTHNICIFTGYDIEYVKKLNLTGVKYFKCGTYKEELKQKSQKTDDNYTLASSNQNFYDSNYKQLSENGVLWFTKNEGK